MIARKGASLNPGFGRAANRPQQAHCRPARPGWSHARCCDRWPSPQSANATVPWTFLTRRRARWRRQSPSATAASLVSVERAEHLGGVLAKTRRRPAKRTLRVGKLHRHPERPQRARGRVLGGHGHAARQDVRIGHRPIERERGARRNAGGIEGIAPVRRWLLLEAALEQRDERLVVAHAQRVAGKPRIGLELGRVQELAQPDPEVALRGSDRDPAVGRGEYLVGPTAAMRLTKSGGGSPVAATWAASWTANDGAGSRSEVSTSCPRPV